MIFRRKRRSNNLSKNRQFKKLFGKKLVFIFALVLLGLIFFIFLKATKISKIEVTVSNAPCADTKYIRTNNQILGKSIFTLKEAEVIRELRKKYLCVKDIQIKKNSLNSISLKVSGRNHALTLYLIPEEKLKLDSATASALIRQKMNFDIDQSSISGQLVVDKEGVIYDKNKVIDSPLIIYGFFGNADLGKTIDQRVVENTLEVSNKLKEWNIESDKFKIVLEKYLLLKVLLPESEDLSRVQIVFNLKEDILRQLASLQLILQKTRIDLKKIESVDLRFEKPVVIYSSQKNGKG